MKLVKPIIVFIVVALGVVLVLASKDNLSLPDLHPTHVMGRAMGSQEEPSEPSERTKLMFVFHHIDNVKDRANALNRYRQRTSLSGPDFNKLRTIAINHEREVAELDRRAKAIIDNYRATYPPGMQRTGFRPPPPPAELVELQNLRNATTERYGQLLKTSMGESSFGRFEEFLGSEFPARNVQLEAK